MKLTWYSNAPWAATGYGTQTLQVTRRLRDDGHKIAIIANHGLTGAILNWEGMTLLPAGYDVYSNDVLAEHHKRWLSADPAEDGWLITLFDTWVIDPMKLEGQRVASWVPIDHTPVPPKVAEWCRNHRSIAMSRFGQAMLADKGIPSVYIPHAIEKVFHPTPSNVDKTLDIPEGAFLVMVNAANKGNVPPRKSWSEMFMALAVFMARHPDAYLYIHTDALGLSGVDLPILATRSGLPPERTRWPDQYAYRIGGIRQEHVAALYTRADVLLATSMGEGFGIPVIEAQACGTPVIVTDFSAQPELVGGGWKVGWQPFDDVGQSSYLALPSIPDIAARLDDAYDARGDETIRAAALAKAAEYDADLVYATYWRPFLAELEAELSRPVRIIGPNRLAHRAAKKRGRAA